MSAVKTLGTMSDAFLWASQEASVKMKKSLDNKAWIPSIEARILTLSQIVSSAVSISFQLTSAFFISLWALGHGDIQEVIFAVSKGAICSCVHMQVIFESIIALGARHEWTMKSLDHYQPKNPSLQEASAVDMLENCSDAFLQLSQAASAKIEESIRDDLYTSAFEARVLCIAQAVSSSVAVPFLSTSTFFISVWKIAHGEGKATKSVICKGLSVSWVQVGMIFKSLAASGAYMEWSKNSLTFAQPKLIL